MPRASRQIALFISPILAILAADTKDDKSTPAPISVKLALDKTEPPVSVKYAFLVDLPSLCIADKLDTDVEPQKVPPHGCPKDTRKVKSNVDDLVTAFTKATEYIPQKADDSHIRFFCAAKVCNVDKDKARITADINASAKPSPRYYEDFTAPSKVKAADLAEAIERMTKGDATGRLLPSGQIRVE